MTLPLRYNGSDQVEISWTKLNFFYVLSKSLFGGDGQIIQHKGLEKLVASIFCIEKSEWIST